MSLHQAKVVKTGTNNIPRQTNQGVSSRLNQPKFKLKFDLLSSTANIGTMLSREELDQIGSTVVEDYRSDLATRKEWERKNADGMKLAMQVVEAKSFPWENCSNVKFPLLTVGALQFLSRVAVLTKGKTPVKCTVFGADPKGEASKVAKRIGQHMSFQLIEEDLNWRDDDEKCKFAASLMGCAFKKTYWDSVKGIVVSEYVPAQKFVVDYNTKNLDRCNRATHLLEWTRNDVAERENAGVFLEMDDTPPTRATESNELSQAAKDAAGTHPDQDTTTEMFDILEQHKWLDLDGDGYAEPYVVFVRLDTKQTLRIVARFYDEGDVVRKNDALVRSLDKAIQKAEDRAEKNRLEDKKLELRNHPANSIIRITPPDYFTKYTFIPSPDGGFYDLGLIALMGPTNEAVNTTLNQMIDSGTMNTTAGGFLGRGVKLKGGQTTFNPFEWKTVDSPGDDLRKNIFPLPVREPSTVLFQLLSLLISYGEKIAGSTDIMMGISPGQNTPAETSRNTLEQGMKIFSGIFTRMHRSFTYELRKVHNCNRLFLRDSPQWEELTQGTMAMIAPTDYDSGRFRVYPAVDAEMVSETQRQQNATMVLNASNSYFGYNKYLVHREFLESYNVADIDLLLPDPQGPNAIQPPQNPKVQIEEGKLKQKEQDAQREFQLATKELEQAALESQAKILKLQAEATKLLAEADGVDKQQQISLLNAQIGAAKVHEEGLLKAIELMQRAADSQQRAKADGVADGASKQAGNAAARMGGMDANANDPGTAGQTLQ